MRFALLIAALFVPIGVLSVPTVRTYEYAALSARQNRPVKPKPCVSVAGTTEDQTHERFNRFADAFIYKKNITAAFELIRQDYINHNPAAQNGFDSAWNILSPIWASQNIMPLRTAFKSPQGWLNYRTGSFGEVVDRYRWEGGCIVEHWDQGEKFPTNGSVVA